MELYTNKEQSTHTLSQPIKVAPPVALPLTQTHPLNSSLKKLQKMQDKYKTKKCKINTKQDKNLKSIQTTKGKQIQKKLEKKFSSFPFSSVGSLGYIS